MLRFRPSPAPESYPGLVTASKRVATAARPAGRPPLAAGVETPAQLQVLREMGYESVQGYLTGAPAPLIDLRGMISDRRVPL